MTLAHILSTVTFIAGAACLSPAPAQTDVVTAGETRSGLVQLSGFVELYAEEGVHLLSGGREIALIGETGLAVPLAGGEVLITGRFLCDRVFRVESVVPAPARQVARRNARK